LHAAIPHRHTNRNPFDPARELPQSFVDPLANLMEGEGNVRVFLLTGNDPLKRVADLIWETSEKLILDPAVARAMERWERTTKEQMCTCRDGTYVGEREPGSKPSSTLSYRELMTAGRLFGVVAVRDRYNQAQTIPAGRLWQRAHLFAIAHKVAARPANGAVEIIAQERRANSQPIMSDKLIQLTGDKAWQPTFMFYMSYPTERAPASVRRPLSSVLLRV
jgi:hypothetical protein